MNLAGTAVALLHGGAKKRQTHEDPIRSAGRKKREAPTLLRLGVGAQLGVQGTEIALGEENASRSSRSVKNMRQKSLLPDHLEG